MLPDSLMPLEGIRGLAGFPEERGSYYLPRSIVEPPKEFLSQFRPEIEELLEEREDGNIQLLVYYDGERMVGDLQGSGDLLTDVQMIDNIQVVRDQ